MHEASSWAAQQLAEFLASVSAHTDESRALRGALELATEAFEAPAAAIVVDGSLSASVGFPAGRAPIGELIEASVEHRTELLVTGVGLCRVATIDFQIEDEAAALILARPDAAFDADEVRLLRSMARVLALTVNNLRVLSALRDRQHLLERQSAIQRLISTRAPLAATLRAVTEGVAAFFPADRVMLYFLDDSAVTLTPSFTVGMPPGFDPRRAQVPVGRGVVGRAAADDELIVIDHYATSSYALEAGIKSGIHAMMAAPVHEHGTVLGSLVVASAEGGRVFSPSERELVQSFAEHASLAVTDAKTVEALHDAVSDALYKAMHDPLTALANRTRFLDRLDHALAIRRRPGIEAAILYVDIDDFKLINDRFGHVAGDRLLLDVAERLTQSVRSGDTVARLGGDEFAVLLEQTAGPVDAEEAAQRILDGFRSPFNVAHADVAVTASVGIALASTGGLSADEVLRNADVAMYRAKNAGKDRAVVFESSMYESLLERIELEADLRKAIKTREVDVHFQPIVDLDERRVVGVEALARWQHTRRGPVAPATFVPLAEETGVITALGRQILFQACHWLGDWHRQHPEQPIYVSVNVSASQLQDPGFPEDVARALIESHLDPQSLVLEITESVLMQDTDGTLARLGELKALGVRLALDDFGTGYSSLSYLRRFPVDLLKIDRSFVTALCAGTGGPSIIEAIIALGDALRLECVAEGVEEVEELEALRAIGCRLAQGFHFAEPMPADQLGAFLLEAHSLDYAAG